MFSDGCSDSDCWGCSSQSAWETFHINMFRLLMRVSPEFDVLAAVAHAFEWSFEGGYHNCTRLPEGGWRRRKIRWRSFVMPRSILTSGSAFLLLILSSASIPTLSLCLSERRPPSLLHPLLLSSFFNDILFQFSCFLISRTIIKLCPLTFFSLISVRC